MPTHLQAAYKQAAAIQAANLVESGMIVGLGTGSTALHAIRRLAERIARGELRELLAIATSTGSDAEARRLGIPLMADSLPHAIDLTIDGADEVDPAFNLIKGGGGALLREKIVAQASQRLVIVVDESKLSPRLGTHFPVPVEVLPFGLDAHFRYLETLGARPIVRQTAGGAPFQTDNGHLIIDCQFGPIAQLEQLATALANRAGLVEHGLFLGMTNEILVGGPNGVRHLRS